MEKPNIDEISNKRASQYRDELRELEVDHPQDELGKIAFKDGYDFALEDFAVSDMIDALIEVYKQIPTDNLGDISPSRIKKIEQALSKVGANINETGDK